MSTTERGMGLGLRTLNRLAGSQVLDRTGMRKPLERALYRGTRSGFRTVGAANRTFSAATKLARPARQTPARSSELFDISLDDEQQMLREAVAAFAAEQVRPAAPDADRACATPKELLSQANELGVSMLGIPEQLGGVMAEQSAVTAAVVAEALAHGDMGIALAALAPGAVATALGLWGDAEQQASYLPAFASEQPPAAALALLEPRALFDPLSPSTTARREGGDWVLNGAKSLVVRAGEAELFVIAAATGTNAATDTGTAGTSGATYANTVAGPGPGLRDRRCSSSSHPRPGCSSSPSRRWACAPPRPGAWCSRMSASPPARCWARAAARCTASACSARGSPGARSRSGPRRRCSTT